MITLRANLRAALAASATLAATVALATAGAGAALAGAAAARPALPGGRVVPLPAHVFAPYFETYSGDNLVRLARKSGARYQTLAFLQTRRPGSCTVYWNGDARQPVSPASYGRAIATLQAAGGNAIPSFGGYTADTTRTDIADSCRSVSAIARVYEHVITTYHVPRIDLDIEEKSLTYAAGIDRRNRAVAQVERWAAARRQPIQFSYTLPSTTTGLDAGGLAVLRNAIARGARASVVNLMTFDYYQGPRHEMAAATQAAVNDGYAQLQSLYPQEAPARVWHRIGVTEMPGIDDFGRGETFTRADAVTIADWARATGIGTLSFWALQRDNGGCPGTQGSDTCSGLHQPAWYFSHAFAPFTSRR